MKLIITFLVFIVLPVSLWSQPAQVKKVINKVLHLSKDKNSSTQARSGENLYNGDELTTGEKSLATVTFIDDQSTLIVRENSNLEIYGTLKDKKLSKNTVLNKGKLNFNVTHRKDQDFIFTTPTAVASIRGTTGSLFSSTDEGTLLYVDSGSVEIHSSVGNKQTGIVSSGKSALINNDGEIVINDAKEEVKLEYKKNNLVKTKKVTIKTDKGDIIIEYLQDENEK